MMAHRLYMEEMPLTANHLNVTILHFDYAAKNDSLGASRMDTA